MFELRNKADPQSTYCFDKRKIVIGEGGDFNVPQEHLGNQHVVIEWKNEKYVIENKAHDPFTLINQKPFWKKKLEDGDLIQFGHAEFIFHKLSDCFFFQEEEEVKLAPPSKKGIHTIDELLQTAPPPATIKYHPPAKPSSNYWHLFVLAASCLFLFVVLFSTTFYITITERAEVERLFAARGLADISMILTFAKEQSIDPPFKNWLDPDFLKEIGQKIIPKELSKHEWIDAEGHFLEAPYILRLYSDSGFSRFLLIAQPIAHNFQSILPKATLVIDSDNMVIKEFWKLRDLNRLLISTSGFEGIIKTEIGELIEKADSIPLDALARGKERLGFQTPDELALVDPEAIFPIYNAPRYYMIYEPIVDQADKVARNPRNGVYKEALDQLLKTIDGKSQVLYSTKGIEAVIGARKVFTRKGGHLLGYLQLNPEGRIEESHLLMPNQRSWSIGAYHHKSLVNEELNTEEGGSPNSNLHQELTQLLKTRQESLHARALSLIDLIQSHLQNPDLLFFTHFNAQFDHFKETSQEAQSRLDQSLKDLFEKYVLNEKILDLNKFLSILDEHQIDLGLNEDPEIFDKFYDVSIAFEAHLNHLFELIEEVSTLDMLDSLVLVANDLLNQQPHEQSRTSWKKHLKMLCIRKLETILWQPEFEEEQPPDSFDLQWKIARILKNGYINDTEGRSFYLSHFLEEVDQLSQD